MTPAQIALMVKMAYLKGFNDSGEGYNGEYPFGDHNEDPVKDPDWCERRDMTLSELLALIH